MVNSHDWSNLQRKIQVPGKLYRLRDNEVMLYKWSQCGVLRQKGVWISKYDTIWVLPGALGGRLMMAASSSKFWISGHFSHYWNVRAARRALAARFIIGNPATRDGDFYSGNFLFMQMDSYQQISSRGDRCGSKAAPFIGLKCERIFLVCFYCRVIAVGAV